ncbi:unnamed protein product [Camellia sinensis]
MRIRKRFPSSSLSSSQPLSDPQLNRSPVAVVLQHLQGGGGRQAHPDGNLICYEPSDPPNQPPPPPSDQHPTIGTARFRWVCSDSTETREVKQKELEGAEAKEESWEEEEKSNDTRKGSIFGAEVGTGSGLLPPTPPTPPPTTASSHQGSWCEGDYEVVPLKKRRGTFERRGDKDAIIIMEKGRKMKAKMNSKTNKKCVQPNAGDDEQGQGQGMGIENNNVNNTGGGGGGGGGGSGGGVKKLKRGNMIMEGSRCSRVNGRGWRCCQQTLVGYSLCEHHLGKGRLRSITSVRSRAVATIATTATATASAPKKEDSSLVQEEQLGQRLLDDDNVDDEKKPLMITKKRMKLGTVKARSISSLLGQTSNSVVIAPDNNKNTGVL